jgi:hypothetical protein
MMELQFQKNQISHSGSGFRSKSALARSYWAVGDRKRYRTLIDGLEAEIAKAPAPAAGEPTLAQRMLTGNYFLLAAARARAGDKTGADRDIQSALHYGKPDKGEPEDGWNEVADGYADAGLLDDAMAAEERDPTREYRTVEVQIARRLAAAGRVGEAWDLVAGMDLRNRVDAEYQLAVQQTLGGNTDGLSDRADAAGTPSEKALIDRAVARTLTGTPYGGMFKIYRPRDF